MEETEREPTIEELQKLEQEVAELMSKHPVHYTVVQLDQATPQLVKEELAEPDNESAFADPSWIGSAINEYLNMINQIKRVTPDQELELAQQADEGDEDARKELIEASLPLVVYIAEKYQGAGLFSILEL